MCNPVTFVWGDVDKTDRNTARFEYWPEKGRCVSFRKKWGVCWIPRSCTGGSLPRRYVVVKSIDKAPISLYFHPKSLSIRSSPFSLSGVFNLGLVNQVNSVPMQIFVEWKLKRGRRCMCWCWKESRKSRSWNMEVTSCLLRRSLVDQEHSFPEALSPQQPYDCWASSLDCREANAAYAACNVSLGSRIPDKMDLRISTRSSSYIVCHKHRICKASPFPFRVYRDKARKSLDLQSKMCHHRFRVIAEFGGHVSCDI